MRIIFFLLIFFLVFQFLVVGYIVLTFQYWHHQWLLRNNYLIRRNLSKEVVEFFPNNVFERLLKVAFLNYISR